MFQHFKRLNFTNQYRLGAPFQTGAIACDFEHGGGDRVRTLPYFHFERKGKRCFLHLPLKADDRVYGLGESLGNINKRGRKYRLFAKDEPNHTPDKASLYCSQPFIIIDGETSFGCFIDYPGELIFDAGFTDKSKLSIEIAEPNFDLYIFTAADLPALVKEYLLLTGTPYVPPRWAFGYQQCRYSYPDEQTVRAVARNFQEHRIPCDCIYLDIDYMQDYKIFTVNPERFPDLPGLVKDLRSRGIRLVPIIDPGVKIEPRYETYETGKEHDVFCKNNRGENFVAAVWPGLTHLPDFFLERTKAWWAAQHAEFLKMGIEGLWNDMNEPAIFYTPAGIKRLRSFLRKNLKSAEQGIDPIDFIAALGSFWADEKYYGDFFHRETGPKPVTHARLHNLYGSSMAQASAGAFLSANPNMRYFLLSRSAYSGAHRYTALWTGDNHSWWEHMIVHMRMLVSLNLCGFLFCGSDVGGFGGDASPELLIRWTQLGVLSPLFRNHSTKNSRHQEPWAFDQETLEITREAIRLRYALIPYLYSEFLRCSTELTPFIRGLFFDFHTAESAAIEDELLVGQTLLAAPVHQNGHRGRFVHLPECRWLEWKASAWDKRQMRVRKAGNYFVEAALSELLLYIRENTLLPLTEPSGHTGEKPAQELTIVGFVTGNAAFTLLQDDGVTFDYRAGEISRLTLQVNRVGSEIRFNADTSALDKRLNTVKTVHFEIYTDDQDGPVRHKIDIG